MNITNQSVANQANTTDPWVESGAMVYVALTVATLSAVIMCCVWFVKQRFIRVNQYGTVSTSGEEHVELNRSVSRESSGSEEEISLEPPTEQKSPPKDAFTMSDSDSNLDSDSDNEHAV
jgi:hypothetical protein